MLVRVRKNYVLYINDKAYREGEEVEVTQKEIHEQGWKFEPISKPSAKVETTAMTEAVIENRAIDSVEEEPEDDKVMDTEAAKPILRRKK